MKRIIKTIMVLALCASCTRMESDTADSAHIRFFVQEETVLMQETKATAVTALESFYVSATQGAAGSESSAWTSTLFSKSGITYSAEGKEWPDTDPAYHFYAANVPLSFNAGGTTVAATNATDVVCAYLPSPIYKETNTLTFKHIFARIGDVTVVASDGYTVSEATVRLTPTVSGTYNIRTGNGRTDGTGWMATVKGAEVSLSNATPGTKANDVYLVPGEYEVNVFWKAAKGSYSERFSFMSKVNLVGGKINTFSVTLGGDANAMLRLLLTPWTNGPVNSIDYTIPKE